MGEVPPTRRRWLQLGPRELALLAALLVPIWCFSAVRPMFVEWISSESEGQFVRQEWRAPRPLEIVNRGLKWSTILLVTWLVVRARFPPRIAPIGHAKPGPLPIVLMVVFFAFATFLIAIALSSYFAGFEIGFD